VISRRALLSVAGLELMLAMVLAAFQTPPSSTGVTLLGVVKGFVRDAETGAPMPGIKVYTRYQGKTVEAVTDEQGRYALRGLGVGDRFPIVALNPALNNIYSTRYITVVDREIAGVDFRMESGSALSGRIVDDSRQPVKGARVEALTRDGNLYRVETGAQTDASGNYRFFNLRPGRKYALRVRKSRLEVFQTPPLEDRKGDSPAMLVATFYPGVTDLSGAEILQFAPGEERVGVDFKMVRSETHCIQGTLDIAGGSDYFVFVRASGFPLLMASGKLRTGMNFEVCGLPPMEYQIQAQADHGTDEVFSERAFASVTVGREDVKGIRLSLSPTVSTAVSVVWDVAPDEKESSNSVEVALQGQDRQGSYVGEHNRATVAIPGETLLSNLLPGDYAIQVSRIPKGAYVKEIQYGGEDAAFSTIQLGNSVRNDLKIVLSRRAGSLAVSVVDGDGNAVQDSSVVLFQKKIGVNQLSKAMRSGVTDQGGYLTVDALAPGEYYVAAFPFRFEASPEMLESLWQARNKLDEATISPSAATSVRMLPQKR